MEEPAGGFDANGGGSGPRRQDGARGLAESGAEVIEAEAPGAGGDDLDMLKESRVV